MSKIDKPRGIVKNNTKEQKFILNRVLPSLELDYLIDHFWSVRWDLKKSENIKQAVLSHPNIHISLEGNKSLVNGIVTKRFEKTLKGSGYVFAIKFKPASFSYLTRQNIGIFTNKVLNMNNVLENKFYKLFNRPLNFIDEEARISEISTYLINLKHKPDETITNLNSILKIIAEDTSIIGVKQLEELMSMKIRKIQRLFYKYIGASPKWVINRYRLHEAMSIIEIAKNDTVFTSLANELGYFDQSHFIKDFKRMIGMTPGEYQKQIINYENKIH